MTAWPWPSEGQDTGEPTYMQKGHGHRLWDSPGNEAWQEKGRGWPQPALVTKERVCPPAWGRGSWAQEVTLSDHTGVTAGGDYVGKNAGF